MNNLNFRLERDEIGQIKHRWGASTHQEDEQSSLLWKKDLQIKRLQSELQNERKRADNALKMLDSFRNTHKIQQESSSSARNQISRRLKAEEQARRLKSQNEKLRQLLTQQMVRVQNFKKQMKSTAEI